jgi:hypothetical protein
MLPRIQPAANSAPLITCFKLGGMTMRRYARKLTETIIAKVLNVLICGKDHQFILLHLNKC